MTSICKKCSWHVEKLDLPEEMLLELWALMVQDSKLYAVKKLKDEFGIDHGKAKGVVTHFNPEFGKCHECNYPELDKEYIECPKCKAFNYNLKIEPPFNKDFCEVLEYKLDFSRLGNEKIKGFWCDGIDHLPMDIKSLSANNLKQKKFIKTKAWIGKDGQDEYEITIYFGPGALGNYINRKNLNECIPENSSDEWIKIDPERKQVEIQLN